MRNHTLTSIPTTSPSWKEAARNARFKVAPTIFEFSNPPTGRTNTNPRQPKRNRYPCSRCAAMQKKCNIVAPYNQGKCEECTKAGVPLCPPHAPRKTESNPDTSGSAVDPQGTSNNRPVLENQTCIQLEQQFPNAFHLPMTMDCYSDPFTHIMEAQQNWYSNTPPHQQDLWSIDRSTDTNVQVDSESAYYSSGEAWSHVDWMTRPQQQQRSDILGEAGLLLAPMTDPAWPWFSGSHPYGEHDIGYFSQNLDVIDPTLSTASEMQTQLNERFR